MKTNSKIYVAGHRGLVGSAIVRNLRAKGFDNIVGRTHAELDLTNSASVDAFFAAEKPEYVFLAAAKVGGIMANNIYRADFILENLNIQNNVIASAYKHGCKKLLFLGSSCIYPKDAPQPLKEEYLLTNELEYTNEPYALAKIAGIRLCESFNIQCGTNFVSVMPTNLYGPNDNYDLEKSHVLPAMIRKMHLAKALEENNWKIIRADFDKNPVEGVDGSASESAITQKLEKYGIRKIDSGRVTISLWGSGAPMREFLHSDDMADACVFVMQNIDFSDIVASRQSKEIRNTHINIGSGVDLSIKELAQTIKDVVGFGGNIEWDSTKPDGTMRKLMDVTRLGELGWKYKISLSEGIKLVYTAYCNK
jgi:GDP-L-fucose synthase